MKESMKEEKYINSNEQYKEICNFLNILSNADPDSLWESGRMNFWRYNVHAKKENDDPFFENNVRIWREDVGQKRGKIIALCISEYGGNDMFVETLPEYKHLYSEMFRWIEKEWAVKKEKMEIDVFSSDSGKIAFMEEHGYQHLSHSENRRFYDMNECAIEYHLEKGFTIRSISEITDYKSRIELVKSAFGNEIYSEENLKSLISSPDHIDRYHLVVVSPEGQHVAYCIGWPDKAMAATGYIEPIGTHASFRKRGFAKAVIRECFKRMKSDGIMNIDISSMAEPNISNFLYDSLGPKRKREIHKYGKTK